MRSTNTLNRKTTKALPMELRLMADPHKPLRGLVNTFAKKLIKLRPSKVQASRWLGEFVALNRSDKDGLNQRRNVFGRLPDSGYSLRLPRPASLIRPWRQRRLQRKLEYRERRATRRKRHLRWRAFRLRKRWKRSIARRFAKSYLIHQAGHGGSLRPLRRRLTTLREMAGLQAEVVRVGPATAPRPALLPTTTPTSTSRVTPTSQQLPSLSAESARAIFLEGLGGTVVGGAATNRSIQPSPAEELWSLICQPSSANPVSHPAAPGVVHGSAEGLLTDLTSPSLRLIAKGRATRAIRSRRDPVGAQLSTYTPSLRRAMVSTSESLSELRLANLGPAPATPTAVTSATMRALPPTYPGSTKARAAHLSRLAFSWEARRPAPPYRDPVRKRRLARKLRVNV